MKAVYALALMAAITIPAASAVELTVTNNCPYTIWLATTPNFGIEPLPDGTVELATSRRYVYQIPNGGWAGRFWPKFGCDQSGSNCEFGDSSPPCPANGCQPPADTKVEFNFPSQPPTADSWYDVSLVDGYSLPMNIDPRGQDAGSCIATNCAMKLDQCPQNEIDGLGDLRIFNNGKVVACLSPCKRWYLNIYIFLKQTIKMNRILKFLIKFLRNYPPPFGLGYPELEAPGNSIGFLSIDIYYLKNIFFCPIRGGFLLPNSTN